MEKKNIPELRFKGFEDEWVETKFIDIATMSARIGWQNLRTSEFLDTGDYMLITGTDFDNGKINFSNCYYVEKDRYDQDRNIQIRNGNILITKDGTIGKVAFVEGLKKPATLNAGVFNIKIRNETQTDNKFLFQYLKAPFLLNYVDKKAIGGTIKHLNQNVLVDFPVNSPQREEQVLLGNLYYNLDKKLELEKEKHNKLKDFKKSMLEDMFPKEGESIPKLRFDGFDGQWSTYELSELGHKYTSLTGKTKKDFGHGSARYITFINVLENPISKIDGVEKIEIDNNQTSVKKGDIFFNISSETYDEVGLSSVWTYDMDNYYLNSFCTGFRPNVNLDSYFISYLLRSETLRKQITKLAQGISRINISQTKLLNIKLLIPEYQEQEKIGNFFKNLDQKIEASEEKIKKIEDFKKSLMEKMFV